MQTWYVTCCTSSMRPCAQGSCKHMQTSWSKLITFYLSWNHGNKAEYVYPKHVWFAGKKTTWCAKSQIHAFLKTCMQAHKYGIGAYIHKYYAHAGAHAIWALMTGGAALVWPQACIYSCIFHVSMYIHTYMYIHTCTHTYVSITHIHTYIHTYIHATYMLHTYIHTYIHTYVYKICIYTHKHKYICIHTYLYGFNDVYA